MSPVSCAAVGRVSARPGRLQRRLGSAASMHDAGPWPGRRRQRWPPPARSSAAPTSVCGRAPRRGPSSGRHAPVVIERRSAVSSLLGRSGRQGAHLVEFSAANMGGAQGLRLPVVRLLICWSSAPDLAVVSLLIWSVVSAFRLAVVRALTAARWSATQSGCSSATAAGWTSGR